MRSEKCALYERTEEQVKQKCVHNQQKQKDESFRKASVRTYWQPSRSSNQTM